jgi:hypothetical protein
VTGPAVICFHNRASGMFVANRAQLVGSTLSATGYWTKIGRPVTRSWSMSQVREVRWALDVFGEAA